ncbi:MAG: hypothetical protein JW959_11800 [Pirellulales bacterium]|nr:hypothetical protein [Pirellulales bacterium]
MNELTPVPYVEARKKIRGGDLLLFRTRGWPWRMVGVAGRSEYSHAAMAGWWNGRLMCIEMCGGGGRATLLSNVVRRRPGAVDVYQANAAGGARRFSRSKAVRAMIDVTGRRYGWFNLVRAATLHLPIVRFFVKPETDDAEARPPFCSQAVAAATRAAGVDPVPNLADRITEPGDLARSSFYTYRFTLV